MKNISKILINEKRELENEKNSKYNYNKKELGKGLGGWKLGKRTGKLGKGLEKGWGLGKGLGIGKRVGDWGLILIISN